MIYLLKYEELERIVENDWMQSKKNSDHTVIEVALFFKCIYNDLWNCFLGKTSGKQNIRRLWFILCNNIAINTAKIWTHNINQNETYTAPKYSRLSQINSVSKVYHWIYFPFPFMIQFTCVDASKMKCYPHGNLSVLFHIKKIRCEWNFSTQRVYSLQIF